MILAQGKEVLDAATKIVDQSAVYGPASFYLGVFFLFFCVLTGWLCAKVILPVAKAAAEALKSNSETLSAMGLDVIVIRERLSDIKDKLGGDAEWPSDAKPPVSSKQKFQQRPATGHA